MDYDLVRRNISDLMRERGLKATPWAQKAGLSERYITHFLTGQIKKASAEKLMAMARAADVPVSRLTGPGQLLVLNEPPSVFDIGAEAEDVGNLQLMVQLLREVVRSQREHSDLLRQLQALLADRLPPARRSAVEHRPRHTERVK